MIASLDITSRSPVSSIAVASQALLTAISAAPKGAYNTPGLRCLAPVLQLRLLHLPLEPVQSLEHMKLLLLVHRRFDPHHYLEYLRQQRLPLRRCLSRLASSGSIRSLHHLNLNCNIASLFMRISNLLAAPSFSF